MREMWAKGEIDTFDVLCQRKGVNNTAQITTVLCDEYMNTVQTKDGVQGTNFAAHDNEIKALAKHSVKDQKRS
jgi:hypothetical protein